MRARMAIGVFMKSWLFTLKLTIYVEKAERKRRDFLLKLAVLANRPRAYLEQAREFKSTLSHFFDTNIKNALDATKGYIAERLFTWKLKPDAKNIA